MNNFCQFAKFSLAGSEFMTISVSVLCQLITMAPSCTFLKITITTTSDSVHLAISGHFWPFWGLECHGSHYSLELSQFNYVSAMFDAEVKQSLSLCN